MTFAETPGSLKRFRRTPWRFQTTFSTPLRNLPEFTAMILSSLGEVRSGIVLIDRVVFEPVNLIGLLKQDGFTGAVGHDVTLEATGAKDVGELLEAALGDWLDFAFVPSPKPFVLYADHDEFTTFYANTKSHLNRVVEPLKARGFREVPGFVRDNR
ncbi:MAG: hypothetical protein U1G08_17695 [Verrucomicrobiota bacterium]